jgi:hypothetical protein
MLEHIVFAAMTLNPAVAYQPCDNFLAVYLRLCTEQARIMRKYWRIRVAKSI